MRLEWFLNFLLVLLVSSCSGFADKNRSAESKSGNKTLIKNKPISTFSDTLIINIPAAVFYSPDSMQLEKIRSTTDKIIFEATMHESEYLTKTARLVIRRDMPKLKVIDTKNVGYLLFKYRNNTSQCIDLNEKSDAYGLFLFNTQKPPVLVDMANIETQLAFYFSK